MNSRRLGCQHGATGRVSRFGTRGRAIRSIWGIASVCIALPLGGCRAHPISLAISLVGDVVDDRDLAERKPRLVGKEPSAADVMFGLRHDTLVETQTGWQWLIYPEPHERFAESFYVVEVGAEGTIAGLFKCKRNIDGLEDVEKARILSQQVYGKLPAEAEAAGGLRAPIMVMRSQVSGAAARIYDVRNWTHTRGARYCVLVFGPRGTCEEVRLIGVTAEQGASSRGQGGPASSQPGTGPPAASR